MVGFVYAVWWVIVGKEEVCVRIMRSVFSVKLNYTCVQILDVRLRIRSLNVAQMRALF